MAVALDKFLGLLQESGLIPREDLAALLAEIPAPRKADGEQLARELVKRKKLTAYQAQEVYGGRGKKLVLGNYVIQDKLGQGGMGMVLKAEHRRMERIVALKVMSKAAVESPEAVKRFHREVKAAAKLSHPNIVTAFDADEAGGTHFFVMEFVEGTDLSQLVKKNGPLAVEKAVTCILQAARGLEFAHEHGIVHRDIKPANLLLDARGNVKILDMGLARIESIGGEQAELTGTGQIMGTVDYMAPEQAVNTRKADHRADIYALGITLWYLLTGKTAYAGETVIEKLMAHQSAPIPSLTELRQDVSPALEAVFRKMVAKTPPERYQSMTEVIAALEKSRGKLGDVSPTVTLGPSEDAKLNDFLKGGGPSAGGGGRESFPAALSGHRSLVAEKTPDPVAGSTGDELEQTIVTAGPQVDTDPQTQTGLHAPPVPPPAPFTFTALPPAEKPPPESGLHGPIWTRPLTLMLAGGTVGGLVLLLGIWSLWHSFSGDGVPRINIPPGGSATIVPGTPDAADVGAKRVRNDSSPGSKAPSSAIAPFTMAEANAYQDAWATHLGVPREWENSIGMKFVLIPPGEFTMGSTKEEIAAIIAANPGMSWAREWLESETPQKRVTIARPFYLGVCEVTVGQFRRFVREKSYKTVAERMGGSTRYNLAKDAVEVDPAAFWNSPDIATSDDMPVHFLVAEDAREFHAWLSAETRVQCSLPTEAQWEFACRAGTTARWFFGDDPRRVGDYAWVLPEGKIHPVGEKFGNPFGLYDICGNVQELALDASGKAVLRGGDRCAESPLYRSAMRRPVEDRPWESWGFRTVVDPETVRQSLAARQKEPAARGSALAFAGADEMVDLSTLKIPAHGPWTVEGWVTPRAPFPKSGPEAELVFMVGSGWLSVREGPKWALGGPVINKSTTIYSTEKAIPDRPTHIALTRGPEGVSFFVNGVPQPGVPMQIFANGPSVGLRICQVPNSSRKEIPFFGEIDEVHVSKVVRYEGPFTPKPRFEPDADTIALYHFDEGGGDVLHDASANKLDGKVTGAKWVPAPATGGAPATSAVRPEPAVLPFAAEQAVAHQQAWAKYLGREVETPNSVGMKMVVIPPGRFTMGRSPRDAEVFAPAKLPDDDLPTHSVTLTQPFAIAATEVTQKQWQQVMGTAPWKGEKQIGESDDCPATYVSWKQAGDFCRRLSEKEQAEYRLPTEAEWEWACRAGTQTSFSFGDDVKQLHDHAWVRGNSQDRPHPVARQKPNEWGLFDMHGNAWEWAEDVYGPFSAEAAVDPRGTGIGNFQAKRTLRGGCFWSVPASDYRSSARRAWGETLGYSESGFRPVRLLELAPAKP